ncbi:MAG TPA: paraquat-inducible protein A [Tepidisphaeraceae bacterium]|nr:paraquat-inducible protein A [Tepidisphaeraceae bacterium]
MEHIVCCKTCGLVQRMEELQEGTHARCARCNFEIYRRIPDSASRSLALALGAAILYVPANIYPIVSVDYWGMHQTTTIFQGVHGLFNTGSYAVGSLIFCTSILTPAMKIVGLILINSTAHWSRWAKFRTWVYRIIRYVDPWNMLEVTMLAIMVALAEVGKIATVHPGAGVFSFAAVVVLTIAATLAFDPRIIWDAAEARQ